MRRGMTMGILRMSWDVRGGVLGHVGVLVVAMAALVVGMAAPARGDVTYPARPADRGALGFIADEAKLISDADATKILAIAEKLLTEKRVPLIVCTITSMADHGASGWTIERYAMNVFDEWGIGSKSYDYGVLLLVSQKDRKARIELGAGWTRERDAAAANIMSMDIVPAFKRGDYSGGILKGVQQLDALGRVASKPAPPANQGNAPSGANPPGGANDVGSESVRQAAQKMGVRTDSPVSTTEQAYPYSNSYSRGRGGSGGGIGGLSLGCLMIPVIGIIIVLRILKGAIGWGGGGGGWGRSMYPGGYGSGMGGWGSGSSFGGGGGWSGGSSGGGGGGFSGGSFGGGSSGGGGATGSW